MNYSKIYNQLILKAQNRNLEGYTEIHHIIPKCVGGSNSEENLVKLTAREHFIAHMLLTEIHPKNIKLKHALFLMNEGITRNDFTPSSRTYQRLKEERSKLFKGENSIIGKSVIQYGLDGNLIKIWPTIKTASLNLGIHCGDITTVCKNRQKSAGGFQWVYYTGDYKSEISSHTPYKKPKGFNTISPLKGKKRPQSHMVGRYKPINQYDKEGNFIKSYNFIREACSQFGDNIERIESNIGACCRGKQKTAYNYIWRYQEK